MKYRIPETGIRRNILLRTNLLVCAVITLGFIITTWIGYQTNQKIFNQDMENVTVLTSDGIYHEIDVIFTKPISVSLTMGNDQLLKDLLETEQTGSDYNSFLDTMSVYLNAYREANQYDSVFLASASTRHYYNFDGFDRVLEEEDPENTWFFDFMEETAEYAVVIDNDQVEGANDEVTVFINCRIEDEAGKTMGVVGVGLRVDSLQQLLKKYDAEYGVQTWLVDQRGNIEIAADYTHFEGEANIFTHSSFPELKGLLQETDDNRTFWYCSPEGSGYVRSRYIQNLNWYLIAEKDTTQLNQMLTSRVHRNIAVFILVIAIVLYTITKVIRRYNARIIELTITAEQDHRTVYQEAAEQLYEHIYEIDVTHNRAANEDTVLYFESLGVPSGIPYDKALHIIAQKQIKEEYRQGYLDRFSSENLIRGYEMGTENLRYDFIITEDGIHCVWKRIIAHLFFWDEDKSLRMLVYREDIDSQMKRECYLFDQMKRDSLTGLLNKAAAQEGIRDVLAEQQNSAFAFFMLDIDNFKGINDSLGHAAGDEILIKFAQTLKRQFRENDIVGRIGGDEFVAFVPVADVVTARDKAGRLIDALHQPLEAEGGMSVSTSVGVSLFPQDAKAFEGLYKKADFALYTAKKRGRDNYVLYQDSLDHED